MAKLPLTRDLGNLETLRSLLLPSLVAPVFVSVHFERPNFIIDGFQHGCIDTQVGLSILDTRRLTWTSKFTNFNFFIGEDAYFKKSAPTCRWGIAEKIPVKSMLSKINDCLRMHQNRNIVLVGHGFSSDLAVLKALGFDFQENMVITKLDIYILAQKLQMGEFSLGNLLLKLKCHCNSKLHNAGNDAILRFGP